MTGFRVSRTRLLVAACVLVALLISVAAASADRGPAQTLTFTSCGQTPQAATTECATADLPLDYEPRGAAKVHIAVAACRRPTPSTGSASLFFNFGGPGGTAVDYLQAVGASGLWHALNQRFDIIGVRPARRRPEHAVDRLQGQPGDGGHLLGAVHDAVQPRRGRADRQGPRVHQALQRAQRRHPRARLDRERRARHGPDPCAARREQAQLPRLLVRHVPRRDVREPVPAALPGDGARRPGRRDQLHQQADAGPAPSRPRGSSVRSAGSSRPARPTRPRACGFGGSDPWDAYDQLIDQANATPIPAPATRRDPRPVNGDDINFAAVTALYAKQYWAAARAGARRGRRPATARCIRISSTSSATGATRTTASYDPGSTATSRSAPRSSATRATSTSTSTAGTRRGASSPTSTSTTATPS